MIKSTEGRLRKLEAQLFPPRECRGPLNVVKIIEDTNGNIIEGADLLPGGANCKPGPQIVVHFIQTEKAPKDGNK
jgi:hypothetical protein